MNLQPRNSVASTSKENTSSLNKRESDYVQQSFEKEGFYSLGMCGQGSYGKVIMGLSAESHKPLAIKVVSYFNSLLKDI